MDVDYCQYSRQVTVAVMAAWGLATVMAEMVRMPEDVSDQFDIRTDTIPDALYVETTTRPTKVKLMSLLSYVMLRLVP